MIAQNYFKLKQTTYLRQNLHDHRLSPLPMQNSYAKFILAIKTLLVHRFSKFLQVLLGQTKIMILTLK